MNKQTLIIRTDQIRARAVHIINGLPLEPIYKVVISEAVAIRNLEQNAKMWAMLTDISDQVVWYGQKLTKENWKDIITASYKKQTAVPGIDGGFVILGARTSQMSIKEMSDVIEIAYAFGSEQNVIWGNEEEVVK